MNWPLIWDRTQLVVGIVLWLMWQFIQLAFIVGAGSVVVIGAATWLS